MSRWLLRIVWAVLWLIWGFSVLALAVLALSTMGWLMRFSDSVVLPNGFVLKREFDWSRYGRDDMFASDGRTLLARDVEFVCFNDRFVEVTAFERGQGGLFDAETQGRVPRGSYDEMLAESGLSVWGKTCNGYLTGMTGAGLLYDGMTAPFQPPCAWRNFDNTELNDRRWFERPCVPDGWAKLGAAQ